VSACASAVRGTNVSTVARPQRLRDAKYEESAELWQARGMRVVLEACSSVAATLALAAMLCGCAARAKPPAPPPPTPAAAPRRQGHAASVHTGVAPVPIACAAGAIESCNALDDDCNGVIDEGCGYAGGGVQVTIGWDTGADIDLYVIDPSGETLYYNEQHRSSSIGGRLDHDARGDCRREQQNPRIENAYWPAPAPSGTYQLELHYFGPCGDVSQTHVTISVAALGKPLGIYRYQLAPEERVQALSFVIP
jgi:hypothetical protein